MMPDTSVKPGSYIAQKANDRKGIKTGDRVAVIQLFGLTGWKGISLTMDTDFTAAAETCAYWAKQLLAIGTRATELANNRVEANKAKAEYQALLSLAQKFPEMQPRLKETEAKAVKLEAEADEREKAIMSGNPDLQAAPLKS